MLIIHLLAQAAVAAAPPAAVQQGVTSYPPAFFAAQQPATAMDMLNRIPGFSFDGGAGVRGFEGAAGNVLIDGQRPSSKSDDLSSIIARIPAGQVERIDVIRGGAPGIDMQGKTVLANIVRKKGSGVRGMVLLSGQQLVDGRLPGGVRGEISGGDGRRKWEASLRQARGLSDGTGRGAETRIFADGSPPAISRFVGEGDSHQTNVTGAFETPLLGGDVRVNGRYQHDRYKEEEANRFFTPAPSLETSLFHQDTDEGEVGGRYTRAFGASTNLEVVALRQGRDRFISSVFTADGNTSDFRLQRNTAETIGRAVLKHRFSESLSAELGGESALNTLDSGTRFLVNGVPRSLPAASVQVEEKRNEVFAKATWRPRTAVTIDGAMRYETSTLTSEGDVELQKTLQYFKPQVGLAWDITPNTQLRLGLEREVGQLDFEAFVATANLNTATGISAGNPDLEPEQDWFTEAAVEHRFWGRGVITLTLRDWRITGVIDRGPIVLQSGAVFDAPQNIGDGYRQAVILEMTVPLDRLGLPGAQIKGDFRRRRSEVTDPTTHEKREISGLHPADWSLNFSQDLAGRNISYGLDVSGGFRETYYRFNTVEDFKVHTWMRPWLEWRPRPDINVRMELPNLTQRPIRDTFRIYPGLRSAGGAPDIDERYTTRTPGGFSLRIRKNFGA